MDIEINDVAKFGAVADVPNYQLPPEVWSFAQNMRALDMKMEKLLGWEQVFGTLNTENDSFTKVLLHFDGADAGTTITDSNAGGSAHTFTAAGNAQLDTAQSKFGGASLLCDGTGDWVTTADHADFSLGSGAFTIDFWFNCNAATGTAERLAGQAASGLAAATGAWYAERHTTDVIRFHVSTGAAWVTVTGTTTFTATGWHHAALVRTGDILRLFIDGTQEGGDVAFTGSVNNSANALRVGAAGEETTDPWTGWIDEFRLSVGVARWTAAFTAPTMPSFTTDDIAPQFLMPVSTVAANYWIYLGLNKAQVFDGTVHTNITRQTSSVDVDYTLTNGSDWNGTVLGGVPIFNNGTDVPQYWPTIAVGTKLANLVNWPATLRAKILRAHGPFLVAFGVTSAGTSFPHRVKWSHPADPGSVPTSWDETDATVDAGEVDLSDVASGIIQDALALGNVTYIYKETSTWRMRFVGGRSIFDFGENPWLPTLGLLSPRCVALTGDGLRHVLATQDDIIWHNGNTVRSILNNRQKKRLATEIDASNYINSFMFANPLYNEMWFCYPTSGNEFPDAALIMNYSDPENWVVTEANGITFRHAATGLIESPSDETWEDNPDEEWDEDTGPWSEVLRRRVVLAGAAAAKMYNMDKGVTRDTVAFTGTLRREGLALIGRKRNGEWIVDHQQRKLLQHLWPKLQGGPVNIRTGAAETVNGATQWGAVASFDPLTQVKADVPPASGRALAVEFSSSESWSMDGYKTSIAKLGQF